MDDVQPLSQCRTGVASPPEDVRQFSRCAVSRLLWVKVQHATRRSRGAPFIYHLKGVSIAYQTYISIILSPLIIASYIPSSR